MEEIVKNEFLFYSKLAKPLVLNLPKSKDRILSAAWIKKFKNEEMGDEQLRTTYLKLLLFCLQRRKLTGIFSDDPSNYEFLEELPADIDLNEFARNLLEEEKQQRREAIRLEMMGDMEAFPAFTTDCSSDLTEYVAAQDIPNFGVHAFYAISRQPVNKWQRSELAVFPKGIKSAIDTSATVASEVPPKCVCAPKSTASAPEVEESGDESQEPECRKKSEEKPPERKKRRPKKLGTSPPSHPIGEVRRSSDDRITPTWGTNLLEVKEHTDIGHIEEPSKANKALEEQLQEIMAEAEDEEEEPHEGTRVESTASKAKDMIQVIEECKHGRMDKPKKPPSRLAKLGDRSRIQAPKSIKAPKIAVKGMKKGKGKGGVGTRPANLPEEFADWTEKDLEEGGLTWADLMPIEENIDDELQQIEDDVMGSFDDGQPEDAQFDLEGYQETDYDALLLEAEAELAAEKSVYDQGLEEDEFLVEQFDDEIENLEQEMNVSKDAEEVRQSSPALSRGIPVTTPHRSPSPKRVHAPEKVFADENDNLLAHRQSPLQPPRKPSGEPRKKRKHGKSSAPCEKDLHIDKVYKKAQKLVDQDEAAGELDEFEHLERQFAAEAGENQYRDHPDFSPGAADRVHQRAQQQERMLQSPRRQHGEEDDFEMLERQFERETGECPARSQGAAFSPGATNRVRERARQQEAALRTPDAHYDEFSQQFAGANAGLDQMSPCFLNETPPPLSEQEEFEMMLKRRSPGVQDQERFALQYGGVNANLDMVDAPEFFQTPPRLTEDEEFAMYENMLQSPSPGMPGQFYPTSGYPSSDEQGSFGLLPQELLQQQPDDYIEDPAAQRQMAGPSEGEHIYRRAMIRKAAERQEHLLRQGSPQAQEIIAEAERSFEDDIFQNVDAHFDQIEGSPPSGIRSPLSAFASPMSDQELSQRPESRSLRQASPPRSLSPPRQQPPPRPVEQPLTEIGVGRIPSPCGPQPPLQTPPPSFLPGVSSPLTPRPQRPINRPGWYSTPPPSPMCGPAERSASYQTPVPVQFGPRERPPLYTTPRDVFTCSPQGTPLDDVGAPSFEDIPPDSSFEALEDAESPDFGMLPPTPKDPSRTPARRRPPPAGQGRGGKMQPRRLFEDEEESCDPCAPVQLPEPCEVCDSEDPRDPRRKRSRSKRRRHQQKRSSPDDLAEFEALEREAQIVDADAPCAGPPRPQFPSSPGESRRVHERAQKEYERLMQESPAGQPSQFASVPCASGMPTGLSQPAERAKRNELKGKYPATPPPLTPQRPPSPVWSTPEGMSGPSRRRTGFSPEVYDSDFSPSPAPAQPQRFPPPKLLIKRGKAPPSPRTPAEDRDIPGPWSVAPAQRAPCGGGLETPMRGDRKIRSRRLFDEKGKTPRLPPAEESPIIQSPWVTPHGKLEDFRYEGPPLIEDEPWPEDMSPDNRPPILQEGQMYFPKGTVCSPRTPEGLPTMPELRKHRFTPDRDHSRMSHQTAFGRGPGRGPVRESCRAISQMQQIPEFESDDAYRQNLVFEQDLETYDKYYHKPPSSYPASQKPKHAHMPPKTCRSPRPERPLKPLPAYTEDLEAHLRANIQVPPENFPPALHSVCARHPLDRTDLVAQDPIARSKKLIAAAEAGTLDEHLDDQAFEDIAWQFGTAFDYEGGLMDLSPPREFEEQQNYYPDIVAGADSLSKNIRAADFPPRPPGISCPGRTIPAPSGARSRATSIPRAPGRSIPVAPGSSIPRAPAALGGRKNIPSSSAPCGGPSCGQSMPSEARSQVPQRRSASVKPLRETKSSQLRKEKLARDQAAKEAQLKKAEQEKAKKAKSRAKRHSAKRAAAQADALSPCMGALKEQLRQHEIHYAVKSKKKASRPRFAGFQDHPLEEDEPEDLRYPSCQSTRPRRKKQDDIDIRYPEIGEMEGQYIEGNINYPAISLIGEDNECGAVDPYVDDYDYEGTFQGSEEDIYDPSEPHQIGLPFDPHELQELEEYEELERFSRHEQPPCQQEKRHKTQLSEKEELAEFEELERLGAEDHVCPGAAQPRYPVGGVTYSPPRPQSKFGPGPYARPAQRLPSGKPPISSCQWSPEGAQDPNDAFLLDEILPPIFDEMEEEDRLPSPGLRPHLVREEVESMARPEYDPAYRGDVMPKAQRGIARSPCAREIQEEEPLLPGFAKGGSFREGREERKRQRRQPERQRQPYGVMDDSPPEDLPSPQIRPQGPCAQYSPRDHAPQAPGFPFTPPVYTDYYTAPADQQIHPDLVDLAGYDFGSPFQAPESVGLESEQAPEGVFYTPQRYPDIEERELDRRAMQNWQPPDELKLNKLTSPVKLGTSPFSSIGSGRCPAHRLDDSTGAIGDLLDDHLLDNAYLMTPPGGGSDQRTVEEFLARSPEQASGQFRKGACETPSPQRFQRLAEGAQLLGDYGPMEAYQTPEHLSPREHYSYSPQSGIDQLDVSQRSDIFNQGMLEEVAGYQTPPHLSPKRCPAVHASPQQTPRKQQSPPAAGQLERKSPARGERGAVDFHTHKQDDDPNRKLRRYLPTAGPPIQTTPPKNRSRRSATEDRGADDFHTRKQDDDPNRKLRRYLPTAGPPIQTTPPKNRSRRSPSPGPCGPCATPSPQRFQRLAEGAELLGDYGAMEDYQTPEHLSPAERYSHSPQFAMDEHGIEEMFRCGAPFDSPEHQLDVSQRSDLFNRGMLEEVAGYQSPPPLSPSRGAYETPSPQQFQRLAQQAELLGDYGAMEEYQTPEGFSAGGQCSYSPPFALYDQDTADMYRAGAPFDSQNLQLDMSQRSDLLSERMPEEIAGYQSPPSLSPRICANFSAYPKETPRMPIPPRGEQSQPEPAQSSPPKGCRGAVGFQTPQLVDEPNQRPERDAASKPTRGRGEGKGCPAGRGRGSGQAGEVVSLEDYLRSGPVPGAGPQKQEPPRKQVRTTTSITKIVTRRNR